MSNVKNEEINKIHDTLTDLLCSTMKYVPYEEPKEGDWCYEMTSLKNTNRDCRIGILKNIIDPVTGEFETEVLEGSFRLKGRIRIGSLLMIVFPVIRDKSVRRLIKQVFRR